MTVHVAVRLKRGDIGLGCTETLQSNLYNEWLSLRLRWLVTLFSRHGSIRPSPLQTFLSDLRGLEETVENINGKKEENIHQGKVGHWAKTITRIIQVIRVKLLKPDLSMSFPCENVCCIFNIVGVMKALTKFKSVLSCQKQDGRTLSTKQQRC